MQIIKLILNSFNVNQLLQTYIQHYVTILRLQI